MPPKIKFTREKIIETALDIVRNKGIEQLSARSLAEGMGCSPQPIFSYFENMEEVKAQVLKKAVEAFDSYSENEFQKGKYPEYKSVGMAYIRFAKEEKQLFRLLFMGDKDKNTSKSTDMLFENAVNGIAENFKINRERASLFHLEMWIFVHGIASMQVTGSIDFEEKLISNMISDVYMSLAQRFKEEV